jgi:hypothetical protein
MCIELLQTKSLREVSQEYNVPIKSLKRWKIIGHERKKGGGRKQKDPEMEKRLLDWCLKQNHKLKSKEVRCKALEFSSVSGFKASKGWFEKFKRKHKDELNVLN